MARRAEFIPYTPKRILNKGKRADHWFWTRYSAYPYIGCQHGCDFCYCRERKYAPYPEPLDFAYRIKVKSNAPELLRKELARLPLDAVFTGDYQPAERKFGLSRRMLEVCCELGFPVFVLERSPLVLRDLDLLQEIARRSAVVVAFSLIATPDSPGYSRVRELERLAPALDARFAAMEKLAAAGITTGAVCMPVLPGITADEATIGSLASWTARHGGQFVILGGLTLSDQQRVYFFDILTNRYPDLLPLYQKLYPPSSYSPAGWDWRQLACHLQAACQQHGLADRVPRLVVPGEKRAASKRVVENLANACYHLEIQGGPSSQVWALRKAAWAVEDLPQDIRLVYAQMGLKGLASIPNIGPEMALRIAGLLDARAQNP